MALTSDLNDVRPSDDVRPDKCLASILTFPSDRGLGCHRAELSQWESIKDHLPDASALASETSTPWRTFILNGIHRRMAAVLAQGLDMDPSFFDSHILRSRYYVPPSLRDIRCFQLDFPELKAISPSSIYSLHPMTMQLILNPLSLRSQFLHSMPPDRAFILDSAFDRFGSRHRWYAYFRRVSCWVNDKRRISVVILDHSMAHLVPGEMSVANTVNSPFAEILERHGEGSASDVQAFQESWSNRTLPSGLLEKLITGGGCSSDDIYGIASQMALDAWQALFTRLRLDSGALVGDALLDTMTQRLENNYLDAEGRTMNPSPSWRERWESYISQLSTRQDRQLRNGIKELHDKLHNLRQHQPIIVNAPRNDDDKEERRSLNRIAYMGGLLLPFSIVAGVFSMAPDFAPGGHLFFTYWALTVPIALLMLVIIYADGIRKRYILTGPGSGEKRRVAHYVSGPPSADHDSRVTGSAGSGRESHRADSVHSAPTPVIVEAAASGGDEGDEGDVEYGNEEIEVVLVKPAKRRHFGLFQLITLPYSLPKYLYSLRKESERIRVRRRRTEELGWGRAVLTLFGFKPKWASESDNVSSVATSAMSD